MGGLPPLICCIRSCSSRSSGKHRNEIYKYSMLTLTFFCYMSYHISRKPFSVVKGALHRNCSGLNPNQTFLLQHHLFAIKDDFGKNYELGNSTKNSTWCDFPPFDRSNYKTLFGDLDYAFLITYAVGMFFSGMIAERVSLRYFLSIGMILCGLFTSMFGLGYFFNIHSFTFYIFAQILNGLVQTSGWPGVVTCVGNWFGKSKRGFIMGVWNSHTSFGNIIGSVIGSTFAGWAWGYSFVVPGVIIGFLGIVTFLTLIENPEDVNIYPERTAENVPYQPLPSEEDLQIYPDSDSTSKIKHYDSIQTENQNIDVSVKSISYTSSAGKPDEAIGFLGALRIPGVIEFSLCLLFAKLVSYTFLFWLPYYILNTSTTLSIKNSGLLSTLFDVGGIFGGITAGLVSDRLQGRAITCGLMLIVGAVMMYLFNIYGSVSTAANISLLLVTGAFVNGPYALITTAVSADLGTHQVLMGNSKALSTVTAIIDGTGSIGAAIGPFLTGLILPTGWKNVFYMLISSNLFALLFLARLILKEVRVLRVPVWSVHSSQRPQEQDAKDVIRSDAKNQG